MIEKPVYPRFELVFVGPLDPDPLTAGSMFYDFFSASVEGVARRSSAVKITPLGSDAMPRTSRRMVLWREDGGYSRTYRLMLRETQEGVATITGKGEVDELFVTNGDALSGSSTIILEWEMEGESFIKDLFHVLHDVIGVPLPDWLEAPVINPQSGEEAAGPNRGESRAADNTPSVYIPKREPELIKWKAIWREIGDSVLRGKTKPADLKLMLKGAINTRHLAEVSPDTLRKIVKAGMAGKL